MFRPGFGLTVFHSQILPLRETAAGGGNPLGLPRGDVPGG
jgi:hypothetical protein